MFVDTHCHLDDERYTNIEEVVTNFKNEKIRYAINMGCNLNSSIRGKDFAEKFNEIYFACGFHPCDADKFNIGSIEEFRLQPILIA